MTLCRRRSKSFVFLVSLAYVPNTLNKTLNYSTASKILEPPLRTSFGGHQHDNPGRASLAISGLTNVASNMSPSRILTNMPFKKI